MAIVQRLRLIKRREFSIFDLDDCSNQLDGEKFGRVRGLRVIIYLRYFDERIEIIVVWGYDCMYSEEDRVY